MAALTAEGVGKLTVPLLRAELEKRSLDAKGLKAALVARLVEALAGGDAPVRRAAALRQLLSCARAEAAPSLRPDTDSATLGRGRNRG
jgi:far upstream element-binding protein